MSEVRIVSIFHLSFSTCHLSFSIFRVPAFPIAEYDSLLFMTPSSPLKPEDSALKPPLETIDNDKWKIEAILTSDAVLTSDF